MPTYRQIGHSIKTGTQTVGSFGANDIIYNFTLQNDQKAEFHPWTAPSIDSTYPRPFEVVETMSEKLLANGSYQWIWIFSFFTPLMYKYWIDTFIGTAQYGDVTVKAYNEFEVAVYLTAKMHRPESLNPIPGGFQNVAFQFKAGSVIT